MTRTAVPSPNPSVPPVPTEVETALAAWRTAHPTATLAEIEHAVDQHLSAYRATLIRTTAASSPGVRPHCPTCGRPLSRVGYRTRTLRTAHGGELAFTEPSYRCPVCGTGLFPPD
jgi:hypothetical protein